jgi:DNA-directed RNA polymerase specialized sigma24 family protein
VSEQAQDVAQVLATLGTLDERRRTATGLLLQGFVCDEIAARLGISEAAARNLAYRGLDDLRQRLQPQFAA